MRLRGDRRHCRPRPAREGDTAAGVAPVDDGVGDEAGVGHDEVDVVVRAQDGGARADLRDLRGELVDLDPVADLEGALDQDDQARHEVLDDVLQAEADPDPQRGAEGGEGRRPDPDRLQGHERAEDEHRVAREAPQHVAHADRQVGPREESIRNQLARQPRDDVRPDEDDDRRHEARRGDGGIPDAEKAIVENAFHDPGSCKIDAPRGGRQGLPSSSSAASVMAEAPVLIVGSGAGANSEECRLGSRVGSPCAASNRLGSTRADPEQDRRDAGGDSELAEVFAAHPGLGLDDADAPNPRVQAAISLFVSAGSL